jgi:hypothetical protein
VGIFKKLRLPTPNGSGATMKVEDANSYNIVVQLFEKLRIPTLN